MPIDLTVAFIYNYYGVNSGIIFPKSAVTLCKSKNLHNLILYIKTFEKEGSRRSEFRK